MSSNIQPISDTKNQSPQTAEFVFYFGNIEFDKCPICLKFNSKTMDISCRNCLTYICKYCYKKSSSTSCPVCKASYSLQGITFKEKKILESLEVLCKKCDQRFPILDAFTVIRHKVDCVMSKWKINCAVGEPNDIEDLIDYLISNEEELNKLPENFDEFTKKLQNIFNGTWNIFFTKYSKAKSKQMLSLKHIDKDEQLLFLA